MHTLPALDYVQDSVFVTQSVPEQLRHLMHTTTAKTDVFH